MTKHQSPVKTLDQVLTWFYEAVYKPKIEIENIPYKRASYNMHSIFHGVALNNINDLDTDFEKDLPIIINKLTKDGYIQAEQVDFTLQYFITFEGKVFCQQDGYTGDLRRDNEETQRRVSLEDQAAGSAKNLNRLTLFLFLATVAALAWDAYKHYHPL